MLISSGQSASWSPTEPRGTVGTLAIARPPSAGIAIVNDRAVRTSCQEALSHPFPPWASCFAVNTNRMRRPEKNRSAIRLPTIGANLARA